MLPELIKLVMWGTTVLWLIFSGTPTIIYALDWDWWISINDGIILGCNPIITFLGVSLIEWDLFGTYFLDMHRIVLCIAYTPMHRIWGEMHRFIERSTIADHSGLWRDWISAVSVDSSVGNKIQEESTMIEAMGCMILHTTSDMTDFSDKLRISSSLFHYHIIKDLVCALSSHMDDLTYCM